MPIWELLDAVHAVSNPWKAVTLLNAYFDESGTHGGSAITTIAGYVGTRKAWESVEHRWQLILDEFADKGITWFHMTDCVAQKGQFAGIDKPGVDYIITQLSALLGHPGLRAMSSAVVVDHWDSVVKDPVFLNRFPTPFDLCFEDIVRQLSLWARHSGGGHLVVPMFAFQPEYHKRMVAIGAAYSREDWYRSVLGPISFGYPQQVIPLQGADLVAHQMNWDIEKREYGVLSLHSSGPTRALLSATPKGVEGHWFDADGLRLTVRRYQETGEIYPLT